MTLSRRWILRGLGAGAGSLALGCTSPDDDDSSGGDDDDSVGTGPFAGGEYLGLAALGPDPTRTLDETYGDGLDGRRYVDLSGLTEDALLLGNEEFYVRTRESDLLVTADWTVSIQGLVAAPASLELDTIQDMATDQGTHLMECSGNGAAGRFGLLSAARWTGVSLADVLDQVELLGSATRVKVSGFDEYSGTSDFSTPGASWIFTLEQVAQTGMFLATGMNGAELPADHGFPVRLLVPGWFGCTCIKWVDSIELVDDDEPATSQMMEFAVRTHQDGIPQLAREYAPADIQQAAMPIRVERWRTADGALLYRIVGLLWGGSQTTDRLTIDWGEGPVPVDTYEHLTNATWTLWEHAFAPPGPGTYTIEMGVDDPAIPTRRLDSGWYLRDVVIDTI